MKIQFNSENPPLLLAPMAGLSHTALRLLIADWQAPDLYFSEMISCGACVGKTPYEKYYTSLLPDKDKVIFQLVGFEEELFVRAAKELAAYECAGIDINMGCSAPVIRKKGGGIRWMGDLEKARQLIGKLRPLVKDKSLSVKLRIGEKDDFEYLLSFVKALAGEGLDFITLHPRVGNEKFSRTPRWEYIPLIKEAIKIPVIGNGDVQSFEDYSRVSEKYRPDGIMIGRGAVKKPWIFHHIRRKQAELSHRTEVDLLACWKRFFELLYEHQPADYYPSRSRRFFYYSTANLLYGHNLNSRIQVTRSAGDAEKIALDYLDQYNEFRHITEK